MTAATDVVIERLSRARAGMPVAICPPGCGCAGCDERQQLPLDRATSEMIDELLAGNIENRTGLTARQLEGYRDTLGDSPG